MSSAALTAGSTAPAQLLTERPAWKTLAEHCQAVRGLHLRQLFAAQRIGGEELPQMQAADRLAMLGKSLPRRALCQQLRRCGRTGGQSRAAHAYARSGMGLCQLPSGAMSASASLGPQLPR